jgi:hypothetical protein
MKLFGKKKKEEVKEEKEPWWIKPLADLFAIFLVNYTRAKREQEERQGKGK